MFPRYNWLVLEDSHSAFEFLKWTSHNIYSAMGREIEPKIHRAEIAHDSNSFEILEELLDEQQFLPYKKEFFCTIQTKCKSRR